MGKPSVRIFATRHYLKIKRQCATSTSLGLRTNQFGMASGRYKSGAQKPTMIPPPPAKWDHYRDHCNEFNAHVGENANA